MVGIPIIDRYVIGQVIKPLLAAMAIGLALLLAERLVRLLDFSMGKQNSFGFVFEALAYLVPHYLGLALPAAMFLGLLFGFNKMSKDSEIDAFLAAGVGHHRLLRSVVVMAGLLAIISMAIFGWLEPYARYAYRSVIFNVKNVEVFFLAEEGVFMQTGSRTFILDKLSREDNSFKRIFLFDYRGKKGAKATTAINGQLLNVPGYRRPVLRLKDGHQLQVESWPTFDVTKPLPNSFVSTFDKLDTPVGRISKKVFPPRGRKPSELTIVELLKALTAPKPKFSKAAIMGSLHKRVVNVATIFILPFLAMPFAMGRRRGQRGYRFGLALVILIGFHEVIQVGLVAVEEGRASASLAVWLPFGILAAFSLWRFWQLSFTLSKDRLEATIDRISDFTEALVRKIRPGKQVSS
jgi:lipopolysaccharide export system permease protein